MKALTAIVAALWLFAVGAQALVHLYRYGLASGLPAWIGLLDFTPEYSLLMGLVIVVAFVSRLRHRSQSER